MYTKQVTEYYDKCKTCGKEYKTSENSERTLCYECGSKEESAKYEAGVELAKKKAQEDLLYLIGATITELIPVGYDLEIDSDKLYSIKVRTSEGKIFILETETDYDGYDGGYYIGWSEVKK